MFERPPEESCSDDDDAGLLHELRAWNEEAFRFLGLSDEGGHHGFLRRLGGHVADTTTKRIIGRPLKAVVHGIKERRLLIAASTKRLMRRIYAARISRLIDVTTHVVCTMAMLLSAYWLGRSPGTYYLLYTGKIVLLLVWRAAVYRWKRAHYFLCDYCYFANGVLLLYLWRCRESKLCFNILFGIVNPLGLAIPALRNSLVPHSVDKMTSTELHLSPVVVLWSLMADPPNGFWVPKRPATLASSMRGFVGDQLPVAASAYAVWAPFYYGIIFFVSTGRIEKRGYNTLYNHIAFEKGVYAKLPHFWRSHSKLAFALGHLASFFVGVMLVPLLSWSSTVHLLYVIAILLSAIRNGATFYVGAFARNYLNELQHFEELQGLLHNDSQFLDTVRLGRPEKRPRAVGTAAERSPRTASEVELPRKTTRRRTR